MADVLMEPPVLALLIERMATFRAALGFQPVSCSGRVEDGKHLRLVASGGGGDRALVMFSQQITIEAFGETLTATDQLMRETGAVFRSIQHTTRAITAGSVQFYDLRSMGGGLNAEDPITKRARYTRTVVFDVRLLKLA